MSAQLSTRIWQETASADSAYQAEVARCHGYDVYGELLGRITWPQMLLLMLTGELPTATQAALASDLMVALANPGPRHPAVHAAMAGAVGGSPAAACLQAALAVGAGRAGGAREVFEAVTAWRACKGDFTALPTMLETTQNEALDIWPRHASWPGFGPYDATTPLPVRQAIAQLARHVPDGALSYLDRHETALRSLAGEGLNFCGVSAAASFDLGLDAAQAEMLHLLLTLPGAAAHALEQRTTHYKAFPYGGVELGDDPDAVVPSREAA
ncbi:hypothetical protein [Uliginosibacterium sp. H1]|uniref:hypothetical protein n=1 Tax=Uliginosibacterium sp. H1 TaxID=3114757 RepID=UPI002E17CA59|nr:hypothetical protein [Uliginosibacterium sp. H1]